MDHEIKYEIKGWGAFVFIIAVLGMTFHIGYMFREMNEPSWREYDNDTKYSYERISPDSVNLTVCSTQTIYVKAK